jgi:hypothetical protein
MRKKGEFMIKLG